MDQICREVESSLSSPIIDISQATGGTVSDSRLLTLENGQKFFLKVNNTDNDSLLKEAEGLKLIANSGTLKTPKVIQVSKSHLLLEYIPQGDLSLADYKELGQLLAKMHRQSSNLWGLESNNFIGSTIQINDKCRDLNWSEFFIQTKLGPQIFWLRKKQLWPSHLEKLEHQLVEAIRKLLHPIAIGQSSLVHGDLWSGNIIWDKQGSPVVIDPAVYYGHRETDLALASLFGGFSQDFFDAYDEEWPRDPGFEERSKVYMLYHLLNHANIFGSAYLLQTGKVIEELVEH